MDKRREKIVLCVILAGWFGFNALTLTKYPVLMNDETNYAVVSYQFAQHGVFSSPIHGGLVYQDVNYTYSGRLWSVGLSALIAAFGGSLFVVRLYNLLAWAACVWMTYLIARRLYSPGVGRLAALAMGFSSSAFVRFRMLRPDPWTAFSILLLFWVCLRFQDAPSFRRSLVLGLASLLALDVYINIAFFLPACGLFVLWIALSRRDVKPVIGFGLGALVAATGVVLARLYPDAQAAYYQWLFVPAVHRSRVSVGDFGLNSMGRWLWEYFVIANRGLSGVESMLALMGIGVAVWRRRTDEFRLVIFYMAGLLMFGLFYSNKAWVHYAMWLPFLVIMGVRALWKALEVLVARVRIARPILVAALFSPWLVVNLLAGLWLVYSHRGNDWPATMRAVQRLVPEQAGLFAEEGWWFAHQEGPFTSNISLFTLQLLDPDGIVSELELVEYFRRNEVEYVLVESLSSYNNILSPPSMTLSELVDKYCVPVNTVEGYFTEGYGRTTATIYRCDFLTEQSHTDG